MSKLGINSPLRSAVAHELAHLLQEIRGGALTAELAGQLSRAQIRALELQAEQIGAWTIGRELGIMGRARALLASLLH